MSNVVVTPEQMAYIMEVLKLEPTDNVVILVNGEVVEMDYGD